MNEALEKTKSQMRKGVIEYAILQILRHQEAYSVDLLRILKESDLIVVEGTIYPLLTRLRKDGLIKYTWVESTQGPPRKYYVITDKGLEYLPQLKSLWIAMRDSVDSLDSDTPSWNTTSSREGLAVAEGDYILTDGEGERTIEEESDAERSEIDE